jgi:electron transfer flavoprotein beta subunit
MEKLYLPSRSKQTEMIGGTAKEQAAKLVEKLKFEVRAI